MERHEHIFTFDIVHVIYCLHNIIRFDEITHLCYCVYKLSLSRCINDVCETYNESCLNDTNAGNKRRLFDQHMSILSKILLVDEIEGEINLELLNDFAKQGVPDTDPRIRYYLWQLLLMLLPTDRSKWKKTISNRNEQYWKWVGVHFSNCPDWEEREIQTLKTQKVFGLQNDALMTQIFGDMIRTPDRMFNEFKIANDDEEIKKHSRRIMRILYIYSCLNSGYSYTQGFIEICLPLYHVVIVAHRAIGYPEEYTESSVFFFLQNLIIGTGLGDLFTLDQDIESITRRFSVLADMVKIADPKLSDYMFIQKDIAPLQFAFPWVSLLFSEIYIGNDLLFLWDKFLIKKVRALEFAMAIAAVHILNMESEITGRSETEILELLHEIKPMDVVLISAQAENLWSLYNSSSKI